MSFELFNSWFREIGACAWGMCAYEDLMPRMSPRAQGMASERVGGAPRGAFVAAFPYYVDNEPGNLSLYCRGQDYHTVLVERLEQVCVRLRETYPEHTFFPGADAVPIPEKYAAHLAGLGLRGWNTLFIDATYGSFVFLGSILTTLPLQSAAESGGDCLGCGACIAACPSGALSVTDGVPVLNRKRCLTALTQKKDALTDAERELIAAHPYVWGCDLCQLVCPHNADIPSAPLPEFTGERLCSITPDMLGGMDDEGFRARFGGYAFAWKGYDVIARNLDLQTRET